jgi:hypothetical protein
VSFEAPPIRINFERSGMSRFSKIQSSVWSSDKFYKVNDFQRIVYLYLLSCPHGNSAGLFRLREGYAREDLRCTSVKYQESLKALKEAGLIEADGEIIFIRQFLKFNPLCNMSHATGTNKMLEDYKSSNLYGLFYEDVSQYCNGFLYLFDTVKIPYIHGVDTVLTGCHTDTDTDTDTDTESISVPGGTEYQSVFDYYLTLDLIKHKSLTTEMKNAIDRARRIGGYDWDMLKELLRRHDLVVRWTANDGEFKTHKRELVKFFGQKIAGGTELICSEYTDDGAKWIKHKESIKAAVEATDKKFGDKLIGGEIEDG